MNVFQMYVANGNRAGFWIRRATWGNTVARVLDIAGKAEGPLPGTPPYYNDPALRSYANQNRVRAEYYNLHDGTLLGIEPVRCPGTYSYVRVDPPAWAAAPDAP